MGKTGQRPRREEILDLLRAATTPLSAADVAGEIGVHVNTARFHLDTLETEGAAVKAMQPQPGPGRPRAVYTSQPGMERGGARSYELLAQILLSHMSADPDAAQAVREAGRAWGCFLADRPAPFQQLTAEQAVTRLAGLLTDLGFAPEPEPEAGKRLPSVIRLRHCPFLEMAERYGQLVCRIHLGLMQGALAELHAPVTATALQPFAEPGTCLARLESAG